MRVIKPGQSPKFGNVVVDIAKNRALTPGLILAFSWQMHLHSCAQLFSESVEIIDLLYRETLFILVSTKNTNCQLLRIVES